MIHQDWLLVVLTLLAVARLTRLITQDVVFQPFRSFIIRHRPDPHARRDPALPGTDQDPAEDPIVYLFHCRWCSSIWIAGVVSPLVYFWPGSWFIQIPLLAFSASMISGLAAGLER